MSEKRIRLEVYETSDMKKLLEELKEDTKVTEICAPFYPMYICFLFLLPQVIIEASKELVDKLQEYRCDDIFEGCIPTLEDICDTSA